MNFLPFLIAKRLDIKNNKRCATFLISILSKLGISLIIFSLIISFSALNGFKTLLNKTILSNLPNGIIQLNDISSKKWKDIIVQLNTLPGINYAEPYIVTSGLLIVDGKIKLIGIKSFENKNNFQTNFTLQYEIPRILEKQDNIHEIVVSSYLAKYLSIKKDQIVDLIVLNTENKNFISSLKIFTLKVVNIFESHGLLDSNIGYIPFVFFKKFLNIEKNINTIELHISDPFNANNITNNAARKIDFPVLIYTWINSYKNIYNDIKTIKNIVYFTLLLLVVVSCFSVVSISLMVISKKTREIAILRSIGANNFFIQLIFFYYGMRLIITSCFFGLFTGIITILNFKNIMIFLEKYFKNSILLDNIYYRNFLLLKLDILDVILIFFSTILIGIVINWYPAYYASKINPSVILKEY